VQCAPTQTPRISTQRPRHDNNGTQIPIELGCAGLTLSRAELMQFPVLGALVSLEWLESEWEWRRLFKQHTVEYVRVACRNRLPEQRPASRGPASRPATIVESAADSVSRAILILKTTKSESALAAQKGGRTEIEAPDHRRSGSSASSILLTYQRRPNCRAKLVFHEPKR